jgi:hypothetical protein
VANVGASNQDRTISLKTAVRSCINKQSITDNKSRSTIETNEMGRACSAYGGG